MKRFDSGEALAKEMGLRAEVLKTTFDAYNVSAQTKNDPFGKKVRTPRSGAEGALRRCPVLFQR
jgi:hypothetical protein